MTLANKIKQIREKKKLSQEALAKMMNYTRSYVSAWECEKRPITSEVLDTFRAAVGLPGVPLTNDEVIQYKHQLYDWRSNVVYGEFHKAKELQPILAQGAEWSCDKDLKALYDLFSASFYYSVGNAEAYKKVMGSLYAQKHDFNDEQLHWYYRLVGIRELTNRQYKRALNSFCEAEKLGNHLGLDDVMLNYNIANCLTNMGYVSLAIKYLEAAQKMAKETPIHRFDGYIRLLIAANYSNSGRCHEAIAILYDCIRDERERYGTNSALSGMYHRLAIAYSKLEDTTNALKYLDEAALCITENKGSHNYNFYLRARILLTDNKIDEGMDCLDKGLQLADKGTLYHTLLSSLKHSMLLNANQSRLHMEKVAIPCLLSYGKYQDAASYYYKLGKFYEQQQKYKQSAEYSFLAYELSNKLIKGDIEL
ncbi:MAG: helix-turn-helix domain-containing protein [Defluviitaleaceae bacterium]|nr:helix-turn-helix domain-containing protein [Defluviitaleaceae bacterium]